MTIHDGACHCGTISVRFDTAIPTEELAVRACGCSFCRMHGAATVSDPGGRLTITIADPACAQRYRFGLRTADFLLCRTCGTYVAAILPDPDGDVAIVNARTFRDGPPRGDAGAAVHYDHENETERRRRRRRNWTPVTVREGAGG